MLAALEEASPKVEKMPSLDKEEGEEEEEEEASRVVDYRVLASSPAPRIFPGMVVDFTYPEDEYAEDVVEIKDPWPAPGDKAAADLPDLAVDTDGTVMGLVHQEYIRVLLKSPPRSKPLPDYSVESLRRRGIKDAEQLEELSSSGRILQRHWDIQNDIIRQYLHNGYAYVALPVTSKRYPAAAGDLPPLP